MELGSWGSSSGRDGQKKEGFQKKNDEGDSSEDGKKKTTIEKR